MNLAFVTSQEKQEYFDGLEELDSKLDKFKDMINKSKHFVIFAGSGISTDAGIPDFRSGTSTVLDCGPGIWEKKAMGTAKQQPKEVDYTTKYPTFTHMAIAKLIELGIVKYVITQSIDGLLRKSGIHCDSITELHGNISLEICKMCGKKYFRDYVTRNQNDHSEHLTGRICEDSNCNGELQDNITECDDPINKENYDKALQECRKADLILIIGTSLRDNKSSNLPLECLKGYGKIVTINLTKLSINDKTSLAIYGDSDNVMRELMNKMKIDVPVWHLVRKIKFELTPSDHKTKRMEIKTVDDDADTSLTIFKKLIMHVGNYKLETNSEPYVFQDEFKEKFDLEMYFEGHFGETPLLIKSIDPNDLNGKIIELEYNSSTKKWKFN